MSLNVVFDVPVLVAQGLMNGSLERIGGVVRDSSSKQVVMWLQEGGSQASKALANPPLVGVRALATASSLLSAAKTCTLTHTRSHAFYHSHLLAHTPLRGVCDIITITITVA